MATMELNELDIDLITYALSKQSQDMPTVYQQAARSIVHQFNIIRDQLVDNREHSGEDSIARLCVPDMISEEG